MRPHARRRGREPLRVDVAHRRDPEAGRPQARREAPATPARAGYSHPDRRHPTTLVAHPAQSRIVSVPQAAEKVHHRQDLNVVPPRRPGAAIHAVTAHPIGAELGTHPLQAALVAALPSGRRLYCHRDESPPRLAQDVHLDAVVAAPVVERIAQVPIGDVGPHSRAIADRLVTCPFWRATTSRRRLKLPIAPRERLGANLLLQIGLGVSKEISHGVGSGHGERHAAVYEEIIYRPLELQFCRDEREQVLYHGASRQQVGAAALELTRARAREHEAQVPPLDQAMNLVQQVRHLLHLVDHHPGSSRQPLHLPVQCLRIATQTKRLACVQEVIGWRSGEVALYPRRLAGPPRSEQKEGRGRWTEPSRIHSCHFYRKYDNSPCKPMPLNHILRRWRRWWPDAGDRIVAWAWCHRATRAPPRQRRIRPVRSEAAPDKSGFRCYLPPLPAREHQFLLRLSASHLVTAHAAVRARSPYPDYRAEDRWQLT